MMLRTPLLSACLLLSVASIAQDADTKSLQSQVESLTKSVNELNKKIDRSATGKSYWRGAKLAYNLDGASADNIVASTKFMINKLLTKEAAKGDASWTLGVVGNFGNFITSADKDEVDKGIAKVSQGAQGLNVGFTFLRELPIGSNWTEEKGSTFRFELIPGYRLNTFQKVGPDSATVSLNQFRTSFAAEYERTGFSNEGALHISLELSYAFFSRSAYQKIFGLDQSSLPVAEATVIFPLAKNLGLLCSGTFAKKMSAVYQFGVFIKTGE